MQLPANTNRAIEQRRKRSRWLANTVLLLLAASLTLIFLHWRHEENLDSHVPEFIALALLAGGLYLAGVLVVERFALDRVALFIIIASSLGYRLFLLPVKPPLSDDIYRYQWEGRVERVSINPYTVYPASAGLAKLQDPAHPLKTGIRTPAVYPPLTELTFSFIRTIAGYKRLFTVFDLATFFVLWWILALLKQPPHRILIYGWNPTVIVSFALCGHYDSLAIFTMMLAFVLLAVRKPLASHIFLALSFVSKFYALVLLPPFLKRTRWPYVGAFAGVAALAYLPFAGAGANLFRGFSEYAARWEGNASLFRVIRLAFATKSEAEFAVATIVFGLVAYAIWKQAPLLRAGLFLTAGILLLSPNAFPWYFTWTVPFLCFLPNAPWLLMTVTCVLGYSPVVAYVAGQPYRDSSLILALEYAPVIGWLAYQACRALANRSAAPASRSAATSDLL